MKLDPDLLVEVARHAKQEMLHMADRGKIDDVLAYARSISTVDVADFMMFVDRAWDSKEVQLRISRPFHGELTNLGDCDLTCRLDELKGEMSIQTATAITDSYKVYLSQAFEAVPHIMSSIPLIAVLYAITENPTKFENPKGKAVHAVEIWYRTSLASINLSRSYSGEELMYSFYMGPPLTKYSSIENFSNVYYGEASNNDYLRTV